MRFREISSYYDTMNDVLEFQRMRPNVNYRYLIMPSEEIDDAGGLDFSNSTTFPMV